MHPDADKTHDEITREKKEAAEWLMSGLFPVNEIHIFAGASGSGKTTLLIQMIDAWQKGESFFGHKSYPRPYIYLSIDRSMAGVERTFARVGYDPRKFSLMTLHGQDRKLSLLNVLRKIAADKPDVRVIFIEGFSSKVPNGKLNDYDIVSNWLLDIQEFCVKNNITVIGVVHSAKTKEGEEYLDPRQQVLGSVAWAAYTETMVSVKQCKPDSPEDTTRQILFLERNSKPEAFKMEFAPDGYLVPVASSKGNFKVVQKFIDGMHHGEEFTLHDAKLETGLSDSSLRLEISQAAKKKLITRISRGKYVKVTDSKGVKSDVLDLIPPESLAFTE
jgi:uncharacterized protein YdbL (DUF1318 family)